MPSKEGKQTSPEMLKRATLTEAPALKHKKTRSEDLSLPRTGKHVPNPHAQKSSHGLQNRSSHRRHSKASSKRSGSDPKGKTLEQSLKKDKSHSCVTDDTSAGSITPEVSNAPDDDSASSSSSARKISNLESKCAGLCISSDCSSELSFEHELVSSPREGVPEDTQVVVVHCQLPPELIHDILGRLEWRLVLQLLWKLGKDFRDAIHHAAFIRCRPSAEGEFSPSFFTTDVVGDLHWHGFDTKLRKWASLPSLNFAKLTVFPSPDPDLFKDYLVAGDGGLLCVNVGKSTGREKLVVCNPLTRQVKVLPPLNYSRHPVLMHLKVDDITGNYKVIVAGSAAIGTEDLSLKTEEYDSRTGMWECPENSDLPCLPFGLNEYQNGAYFTDSDRELLLCVAIVDARGRGVLVYDLKTKKWEQTRFHIPLVTREPNIGYLATTQIVECGGSVYVFSEQECGREVYFLIHKLNLDGYQDNKPWEELLRRKRTGGRGLLVYPEFTCVAVSEHELCIFNTVEHTAEIIDVNKPTEVAPLLPAPRSQANRFHSLNPIGFVCRPSFKNVVCPRGRNPESRCKFDLKQGEYCSECERRDSESGPHNMSVVIPTVINSPDVAENKEVVAAPSNEILKLSPDLHDQRPGGSKEGFEFQSNEGQRKRPYRSRGGSSKSRVPGYAVVCPS